MKRCYGFLFVLALLGLAVAGWAESNAQTKPEEKVIHKGGIPVIMVGLQKFPDIRLTDDERRRVQMGGVITRVFAVADPKKAPGHPCAGLHCGPDQICLAYDYEDGYRITICADEVKKTKSP